jgi:hypothetical protein
VPHIFRASLFVGAIAKKYENENAIVFYPEAVKYKYAS